MTGLPQSTPLTEAALASDFILPFMIERTGLRGRLVRLQETVDTIIRRPEYPLPVARFLAELLPLTTALASSLKYEGIFTLQTKSNGAVRTLVSDMTSSGHLRGYAGFDREGLSAIEKTAAAPTNQAMPLAPWLGTGHLAFTVDQGTYAERYQGLVALTGDSLSDCLIHYFRQSQQINAGLLLATRPPAAGSDAAWRASALLLESIPTSPSPGPEETEDWRRAIILMASCRDEELLDYEGLAAEELLFRLFHEDGVRVFDKRAVQVGCRCTRDKLAGVLKNLPSGDLEGLKEDDGRIHMTCEFCARTFFFADEELTTLQKTAPKRRIKKDP